MQVFPTDISPTAFVWNKQKNRVDIMMQEKIQRSTTHKGLNFINIKSCEGVMMKQVLFEKYNENMAALLFIHKDMSKMNKYIIKKRGGCRIAASKLLKSESSTILLVSSSRLTDSTTLTATALLNSCNDILTKRGTSFVNSWTRGRLEVCIYVYICMCQLLKHLRNREERTCTTNGCVY